MCIGFFIATLDIQIVSASLRDIGGGLSAGVDETAWVQTSYLIAEIIVIPLSGWLTRVMSTRWLFCVSAIGFTAASLLCGVAWDIHSMIVFRALQGFLGGTMIPTVYTTAFIYFTGNQRVIAAATVGTISSLAPTLGPTIGGWITDNYSWHWLFFINLVPGIFVAVVVPLLVRIDKPNRALLRGADYLGMILMALCLGCLEYTLEEGERWDWFSDDLIRTTAWIAGLAGVAFIWRSLTARRSRSSTSPRSGFATSGSAHCSRSSAELRSSPRSISRRCSSAACVASALCRSASRCSRPACSRSARFPSTPRWPDASTCGG